MTNTPPKAATVLIIGRAVMWGLWASLPAHPVMWFLCVCIGVDTVVLLWQLAMARAAIRGAGASAWSYLIGLLAIIAIAMVGTTALNHLSRSYLPAPRVISTAEPLPRIGNAALLEGAIDFDTYEAMKATLASGTPTAVLILNSDGGHVAAARGIARLVREAGLDTHVTDTCASACTLVLAAGHLRTKTPQARIGFHGYRLNSNVVTVDASEEATRDRADLEARGIDAEFLIKAYQTPHDDMWFPTTSQLRDAGVLTD